MSSTGMGPESPCDELSERLAEVLDGTAEAALFEHLDGCDACRDLKHEATRAAEAVASAGADFRPAEGFVDDLVGRLLAAREPVPVVASESVVSSESAVVSTPAVVSPAVMAPDMEPQETSSLRGATAFDPKNDARPATATTPGEPHAELSPAGVATSDGRGSERASTERGATVAAVSQHVLDTQRKGAAALPPAPTVHDAAADVAVSSKERPQPLAGKGPARRAPGGRRAVFAVAAISAVAAAASMGFWLKGQKAVTEGVFASAEPWSGKVVSVKRASADKTGGLEACSETGACAPLAENGELSLPVTLRTDARTRVHLALGDGTQLSIDRSSRLWIGAGEERKARVEAGVVVAEVAALDAARSARFLIPQGEVEVLGTKLAITAGDERSAVEVVRGSVRVSGERGAPVEVRAGEEALIARGGTPRVASTSSLSDVMEWSDRTSEELDAPSLRGVGELRARKPGSTQERESALRLSKHAVKVRIVDVVARTEVDETFTNETDEELEGIFRFPLPPGAQIERLALEVDGKLMEGAFVDRDRGAAIWRGVIQNAAPKAPRPREEIVWVPGPWRDPALLEWQRGGRFELRIFPIPKRSSRRVVLTYTQLVEQSGGVRRYTYPLAHDENGTTRIGDFSLDVQLLGHDREFGVNTRGYDLTSAGDGGAGERRTLAVQGFTPAGDLTVEYALTDRDKEATAWAYRSDASAQPDASLVEAASKAKTADERMAIEAAQVVVRDTSPYVAIALRPKLPRWHEARERRHVVVVDSSRSMVGERFARATRLASAIVKEMDRRDEFVVLACDTVCRSMDDSAGGARPMAPGASAAGDVERFLGSVEPDGGSDLAAAMIAARAAAGSAGGKDVRIIYLGDGTPTVGPTRTAHLEAAVRASLTGGEATVVAVALGADADTSSLQSLARGGGGVVVPYVPGQRVSAAALDVLGAAYGIMLRDPEVELPSGLTQVTPARLDPIRAGGETFIVARMSAGSDVSGTIRLKGKVSGEKFEQSYPVSIVASSSPGNAFVPRLFAAAKIAELERVGSEAQKPTVIELSKRFNVASRYTSLLVLESEAMFKAFGLDRGGVAPAFTGEFLAERASADAEGAVPDEEAEEESRAGGVSRSAAKKEASLDSRFDDMESGPGGSRGGLGAAPASKGASPPPPAKPAPAPTTAAPAPMAAEGKSSSWRRREWAEPPATPRDRSLVPMRRVFDRKGSFEAVNSVASQTASRLLAAESALSVTPDSRDKTVGLYALYAVSGRLGEAQELTSRWSGRDALDPDALTARADLAARQGDRERAARILGGLADVRPGDRAIQARLAELHDLSGAPAFACRHRLALADLAPGDAKLVSAALQCARLQGMNELADQIRADLAPQVREQAERLLTTNPSSPATSLRGDVQLLAEWSGSADVDLALIDEQGRRISWMGSPSPKVTVTAQDVTSVRRESLALLGMPKGSYVIEISRAAGRDATGELLRGELTLKMPGDTRKIPFTLAGARAELGTLKIFFTSRLVPVNDVAFTPWR
ncbi:VIT domain-containing protein [Chondromyces crocatus]|uniref:VIT domain-containing protein n=1 Tax=Chondromyces crocatus TaxID=52 RepID=A0A0K1E5I6_CHOCO|nr:VIT domain-containing protein [Chondromyces crocatus]AKT36136.1 uncharacterized protein CMC5_002490 [Chondromyces crocatus]